MGRIAASGQIPFIDSHEAKGPIWWYICALGQWFSSDYQLGFFPLVIIIFWVSIGLLYRIVSQFLPRTVAFCLSMLGSLAWLLPKSPTGVFCPEIFMIPISLYLVYLGVKIVHDPGQNLRLWHMGSGILSSIMFWSKFNYVGAFVGFYFSLIIIWIVRREWANLRTIAWVALGFFLITGPLIIFYWVKNGLGQLYQGYFIDNLFYRFSERSTAPLLSFQKLGEILSHIFIQFGNHFLEVALIIISSIVFLIRVKGLSRNPGTWVAVSTVVITSFCGFVATTWSYQFTPYLGLVALSIAYLVKQIIFEIHSRRYALLSLGLMLTVFITQTVPLLFSTSASTQHEQYQVLTDSINSYSPAPSIITLTPSGPWATAIQAIAQSHAVPVGKYWITSLYNSQQLQRVNDITNQVGDLLLIRSMNTGTVHTFFDTISDRTFKVRFPDYILTYYQVRTAVLINSVPLVLLEKCA
ncbi:MAG: hypothetical protein LBD63_01745 [Mycoplasmataceae bacterium]|jgi:hypothetical protein|nr:hypothetical protein [Mycoplasmataceae bacterium]